MLGTAERIAMLRNNPMSASISLRPQISRNSSLPVARGAPLTSFLLRISSFLRPSLPQTPSLPAADPRSDRFRCAGRESKFLAVGARQLFALVDALDRVREILVEELAGDFGRKNGFHLARGGGVNKPQPSGRRKQTNLARVRAHLALR